MPEYMDPVKKIAKEADEWAERQKLLQLSEISLILDTYDDLFSDFDPRNFEHRALSDDFLIEVNRATREKITGVIELHFLVPAEMRKESTENMIRKRLKEHFKKHHDQVAKDIALVKRNGTIRIGVGLVIAVLGAIFLHKLDGFPSDLIKLISGVAFFIAEPASWFLIWEGFDRLVDSWKELKPELEFNKKMAHCEITFTSY